LSATYQYVLDCRGRTLVRLAEELEALERHRTLAEVRYGGDVRLDVRVPRADADRLLLPPVSLAELFQNALKHNTVAGDRPLHIEVRVDDETLVVENTLRPGPAGTRSSRLGLTNMRERFRMATNGVMVWGIERDRFIVRLPLVRGSSGAERSGEARHQEAPTEIIPPTLP
jgi:LytS/YehU family sensor histidine kinase